MVEWRRRRVLDGPTMYMVCPRLRPISASWVSFPCVELARIGAGTISYSPQDICISYFVLLSERVANERRGARKM